MQPMRQIVFIEKPPRLYYTYTVMGMPIGFYTAQAFRKGNESLKEYSFKLGFVAFLPKQIGRIIPAG